MSERRKTAWSDFGNLTEGFLRDPEAPFIGSWAVGQGPHAPDRVHLRGILKRLAPCSLLDVGCGTAVELDGIIAEKLEVDYTGLDFTPEFIEANRARYPSVRFIEADLLELTAPWGYDVVSARAVLEHIQDGETAIRRLYEACKQVCVVSFFIPPEVNDHVFHTIDGFIHHTYSRLRLTDLVAELCVRDFKSVWHRGEAQAWETWEMWR